MKKIAIVIATLLFSTGLLAQNTTISSSELSISIGLLPYTWESSYAEGPNLPSPDLMLSAQYIYTPWHGISTGCELLFAPYHDEGKSVTDIGAMAVVRANWVNKSRFKLYSKIGIGCSYNRNSNWEGAVQYTIAGTSFRLGSSIFGLTELGFGNQGLLTIGIGVNL